MLTKTGNLNLYQPPVISHIQIIYIISITDELHSIGEA